MRWAVLGDKGMFGTDQLTLLRERGLMADGFNRSNLDLSLDNGQLAKVLTKYDVIVNGIAYTNVDFAETSRTEAFDINGRIAGKLASVAAMVGSKFIHLSTDYVFDGQATVPYRTEDIPNPINVYGSSKLLGEQLVAKAAGAFSIVRTAWLYGQNGGSFPKSIANKLRRDGFARVVNDEYGQPTWTMDVAERVFELASLDELPRIYHAVSGGLATRAEQARAVARAMNISETSIQEFSGGDSTIGATRPKWSVLDTSKALIPEIGNWSDRWNIAAPLVLSGMVT